ncbi:RNA-binding protein [Candidatus Saccharibacteria bacterium]|nr:RNA-binding protein [Candidatus Saccharibacteria bacterium]
MVHQMRLHPEPFEKIKNGTKIIEMRLFDEKRQKIQIGDKIEFENRANGDKVSAIVMALYRFSSFEELYRALNKRDLGYEDDEEAKPEDMSQYYSEDDIRQFGVVGIEIHKL